MRAVVTIGVLLFGMDLVWAQPTYQLQDSSVIAIHGTSSLHDWTSSVEEKEGSAQFIITNGKLESVETLSISMVVKGIKSGKRQMDKNTRKALKEKDYPSITFNLDAIERITPDSIFAAGTVTVAGNPVQKEWHVAYRVLDDTYIEIEGIQSLKMTDFNINPPKALLGRLKTGDDIQIEFKAYFNPQ